MRGSQAAGSLGLRIKYLIRRGLSDRNRHRYRFGRPVLASIFFCSGYGCRLAGCLISSSTSSIRMHVCSHQENKSSVAGKMRSQNWAKNRRKSQNSPTFLVCHHSCESQNNEQSSSQNLSRPNPKSPTNREIDRLPTVQLAPFFEKKRPPTVRSTLSYLIVLLGRLVGWCR